MMTPEIFERWRTRHGMTHEECAKELGFKDGRQISNFEKGDSEIPRYVWLATVGFDSLDEPTKSDKCSIAFSAPPFPFMVGGHIFAVSLKPAIQKDRHPNQLDS